MAGFRKAQAQQAAIKMGFYGPAGSGKTFTALLLAEGLANREGKRIAYVDTERGTDFYSQAVPQRQTHPDAFEFDALYTRSITDVLSAVRGLEFSTHGVIVLDSITHLWEACQAAYTGPKTKIGTIPMQAWGRIKKPYKELMELLLHSPFHVLICGRQGVEYAEDEKTEELKAVGYKMKAEGETPYEPHILVRMEACKPTPKKAATIQAFIEKDRTGVLAGKLIELPDYKSLAVPLLGLLGGEQAGVSSEDAAERDSEALASEEQDRAAKSAEMRADILARFQLAKSEADIDAVSKEITPAIKKRMLPAHVADLRQAYADKLIGVKAAARGGAAVATAEEE